MTAGERISAEQKMYRRRVRNDTGCWEYTGNVCKQGYGCMPAGRRGKSVRAHRWMYELLVGPIPPGLVLDHLCSNRRCMNPEHLEPVTQAENCRRGKNGINHRLRTKCIRGHDYKPVPSPKPGGRTRYCPTCHAEVMKRQRAGKKQDR